ncbi:cupin domain-containing protein [Stappia stellulata]|uniref:cupin domain-containing protein n=1 Tax=Stappia stellulata TaxID=71235 RepID=UPI00041E6AE4|nr:cupin domain-containing protein [Stappia stellulata]
MLTANGQPTHLPSSARTAAGLIHARLDTLALSDAPIDPDWILEGQPQARVMQIAEGADAAATMAVWDCTAGRFNWYFGCDEAVFILEGSVTVTGPDGEVRELHAGDTAYFPAYTWFEWHVPSYVRKVAFCHRVIPTLARVPLKVLNRLSAIAERLYTVAIGSKTAPARREAS